MLHDDTWVLTPFCPRCREPVLTCLLLAGVSGRKEERSHRCWTVGRDDDRSKHLLSTSWASGTVYCESATVFSSHYKPKSGGFYFPVLQMRRLMGVQVPG